MSSEPRRRVVCPQTGTTKLEGIVGGIPTIDLFAGAGGIGVAASRAGCDVRLAVELDPVACRTLERNRRHHSGAVLDADVAELDGITLRMHAALPSSEPLIIVGGPPCQPFSKAA